MPPKCCVYFSDLYPIIILNNFLHFRLNMSICDDIEDPYSDKENQPFEKNEELSMYDNGITPLQCVTCSPSRCPHQTTQRRSLDDQDTNSQDSGYGASYQGEKFSSYASPNKASFGGSSLESMEDDFLDLSDVEPLEKPNLPQDFNKLIAKPLLNKPGLENNCSPSEAVIRPLFRRALSLQNSTSDNITPNSSRVRTSLFKGSDEMRCFKRPDPPSLMDAGLIKKSRMFDSDEEEASVPVVRPVLQRAFSATEESIMCAVHRSSTEPDLIGDFSKGFSLPLTISRHQDLKAITPHTLSRLIHGEFNDSVASFKVIDCRYPYEFDGGHIDGALNVYTKEQCIELLDEYKPSQEEKQRHILVFHCEFSSERGPNL